MGYTNVQADVNFYRQSLNADGVKYVTGPYTSLYEDVFRAVTVTTDSVVSVTSYVGDSLSNQFLLAGTEIYGLFSSVTIHSGKAVLHLAGASYISEIINQYSATGIPLGFYEEGTQCLSQKISALLTQGVFDDASWVMVPSQYEEDWVRAFKPTSELGNLAFTRSSDATFTDSTGVVRRSPWNLLQQSEMFSNVIWGKVNSSISIDATLAPNGTLTADKLVENTVNDQHRVDQTSTSQAIQNTFSVYAKRAERNFIQLRLGSAGASFDLLNGTFGGVGAGVTASISDAGNGWYRCAITRTTAANEIVRINLGTSFTLPSNYAGDGTSGAFIWGAQLVEGTEALPYFATTDRLNVPRLDYRNADGTLSTCPRLLLEPQRTNSIRNSSMVGAVAGSPGTLPTNWNIQSGTPTAGLTQTISVGTENGLPYIDFRFNGTATSTSLEIRLDATTQIAALTGQVWSFSGYFKVVSGTVQSISQAIYERNSGGTIVIQGFQTFVPTATLQRFNYTRTLSGGSTVAFVQNALVLGFTNGATYDFTIRIAAPQMELGAYATTWVPTTTTAVTRIADGASKAGVSSLIGQTQGTIYFEVNFLPTSEGIRTYFCLEGSVPGQFSGFVINTGNSNNEVRFSLASYTLTAGRHKVAVTYNATTGQGKLFVDGAQRGATQSFTGFLVTIDRFSLGCRINPFSSFATDRPQHGSFGESFLMTTALSDAECIALTTL